VRQSIKPREIIYDFSRISLSPLSKIQCVACNSIVCRYCNRNNFDEFTFRLL